MNYVVSQSDATALNAALTAEVGHACAFAHQRNGVWVYIPEHLAKAKKGGVPLDLDAVVAAASVGFSTLADYVASLAEHGNALTSMRDEVVAANTIADVKAGLLELIDLLDSSKILGQ